MDKTIIDLTNKRYLRMILREAISEKIDKLLKRNEKIIHSKTYQKKIISNLRDNDFLSMEIELKNNKKAINELMSLLNQL